MNKYTIYCTEEQTRKALELGAPINTRWSYDGYYPVPFIKVIKIEYAHYAEVPTAEEMIGWLEEQGFYFRIETTGSSVEIDAKCIVEIHNSTRKDAILTAINAAQEYLSNNK